MAKLTQRELNDLGLHAETEPSNIDLVCGMELSGNSLLKYIYNGKTYHFCSKNCLQHFKDDPEKYAD